MEIKIREITENDYQTLQSLITEFATYLKKSEKMKLEIKDIEKSKNIFKCYLAETDSNEIIAYALFFPIFHTWTGRAIYLEDIYVKEEFRRHSVGSRLMNSVLEYARLHEYNSVEWQVLNYNKPAIDFYKKIGADINEDKLDCTYKINQEKYTYNK